VGRVYRRCKGSLEAGKEKKKFVLRPKKSRGCAEKRHRRTRRIVVTAWRWRTRPPDRTREKKPITSCPSVRKDEDPPRGSEKQEGRGVDRREREGS